ncbi:3-deoxy-D-manno-octulosonic acid transferase [Tabrizicola sp. YIM 78059]|uniref:3-deoxy-D-manno-octulosonic acid transferase n=1 Tax=Tabrizicola sp. YIM 78059 TaxID=2529861 RepID=UPI00145BF777|nr:glycosyltransferase N-terminal domain-containing protein [Tabrizicola sp. YIM 78059]
MGFTEAERKAWADMRVQERLLLHLYRLVTRLLPDRLITMVLRRIADRKPDEEDPDRIGERLALGMAARPEGRLVWMNAIGPGDATMLLPLIRAVLAHDDTTICLVTTRTASAQRVFARFRGLNRVIVQLMPLDKPSAIRRFLDHWRPELAIYGELETWPNALTELKARAVPVALVNAQLNGRLGRALRRKPGIARWMAAHIDYLHLLTEAEAREARDWFRQDCQIVVARNLKMDAPALPVSTEITGAVRAAWGSAPVLTCASVANSEIGRLLEATRILRQYLPDLRLILVPRWIDQGAAIADQVRETGMPFTRRSAGKLPAPQDVVLVADSYGEMGNWIDLAFVVFMGHTFDRGIGHNPFEPIAQRRMILSGSIPSLLHADYQYLADQGLCHVTPDAAAVAGTALRLWRDPALRQRGFEGHEAARGFSARMTEEMLALRGGSRTVG